MDSSFLTWVNVGLGLYSVIHFLKLIIQFGLPDNPSRFTLYLVSFCVTFFFCTKASVDLGLVSPWFWMRWRSLPIVAGSVALLLQVIMTIGKFTTIQQKVVSRLPLIAGLLCFAFFPEYADRFLTLAILSACLFFGLSAGKARLQKRLFYKMAFSLGLYAAASLIGPYWLVVVSEFFIAVGLFYFFLFENTFGVSALIEDVNSAHEGLVK
jgi:hypothetical protein